MTSLETIRVADCAGLAGAYCGKLLADLGMRVARAGRAAEGPECEWYGRRYAPAFASIDTALGEADVVVTEGRPSELRARELHPDALQARRSDLVIANISPFGLSGPHCEWKGASLVAAAAGGMMSTNGWPDEPPLQPLGLQAYHCAGLVAALGVLLALRVRDRTGAGQLVDVSLQESALGFVEHLTGSFRQDGTIHQRAGTVHWTGAFATIPAADGEVLATHLGDWDALRAWLAADGVDLAEPRWESAENRRRDGAEIFDRMARWAKTRPVGELVEQAQLRRLAFAPLCSLAECERDPQLTARGFFADSPPANDRISVAGARWRSPGAASARHLTVTDEQRALAGARVIDLTWVVAGPVATRLLADHGAEVIKIEHPATDRASERRGGIFGNLNRGKKSVVLDLGEARGLDLLRQLIADADVLVENFSPRVLDNWGLGDDALQRLNPRLVVVHMSGFGRFGPRRDWVSYGPVLQALSGFTAHMRHPGGRAAGWGYSFSDMVAGHAAALSVVAALRQGAGAIVDLSQQEALASMLGPAMFSSPLAMVDGALGNVSQERADAPHGVYRCRDRADEPRQHWCAIAVGSDDEWRALAVEIDEEWARDPRYDRAADRFADRATLDDSVARWARGRDAAAVVAALQRVGVAAAVVADARDLLLEDAHLRQRGAWSVTESGDEVDATPVRLSDTPGVCSAPGPLLGEHTDEVLRQLVGLDDDELGRLRRAGVIG